MGILQEIQQELQQLQRCVDEYFRSLADMFRTPGPRPPEIRPEPPRRLPTPSPPPAPPPPIAPPWREWRPHFPVFFVTNDHVLTAQWAGRLRPVARYLAAHAVVTVTI